MIAIIAEKPSVARDIARIVGANEPKSGYIQGNGYKVTWAFGHLVGLAMPEEYGVKGFARENLPIIPQLFILKSKQIKTEKGYKPDIGALKQLGIIETVFISCDKIIVATDAGREGELIFRYIYKHLNCSKPFSRLWISSLTDKAIRDGINSLRAGSEFDNLYMAAKARSEADWLVGINATQAITIAAGKGIYSLGRVQTPTLLMICKRYLENKNFISQPYWQNKLTSQKSEIAFCALSERHENNGTAVKERDSGIEAGKGTVIKVDKKEVTQEPPLFYDLTALQKEANNKYGLSADNTLSIAQKLYEGKLITYPRTGSRYISIDVFDELGERISNLSNSSDERLKTAARLIDKNNLGKRSVDDCKVTDHHALLITENIPSILSAEENIIYYLIATRMLEAVAPKCIKDVTDIEIECGTDIIYKVKGSIEKSPGWRAIRGEKTDENEEIKLPFLSLGDILPIHNLETVEKKTKPKPLHTESSLLASMESAGKEIENDADRIAMRESGIGTPATRAAIIETLFFRDYISREKKALRPTEKGLSVYNVVKDMLIGNVVMTGAWENALAKIESGEIESNTFSKQIEGYTRQVTEELLSSSITPITNKNSVTSACPKCKSKTISIYDKVAKCTNTNCNFVIFKLICEKLISEKQILDLLEKGQTDLIKGFKSKAGKSFDASLYLDLDFKICFKFQKKQL